MSQMSPSMYFNSYLSFCVYQKHLTRYRIERVKWYTAYMVYISTLYRTSLSLSLSLSLSPQIYHESVLPKGRSFTASAGTKVAVLFKGRSSTANSETKAAVLLEINGCGRFP